jgi:hypothetical protein
VTKDVMEALMKASESALAEVRAQAEALAEDRVLPLDGHLPMAVLAVALSVQRIEEVVAASPSRIPEEFDLANVTRLRTYAAAAWEAHVRATWVKTKAMRALLDESFACRECLLVWARGLADVGWIRKEALAEIGQRKGSYALAHDLLGLAALLSDVGPRLALMGMQDWHLARASALGLDLFVALAAGSRVDQASKRMRARAFSLLAWAYDECRRLIRWLRWEERDFEDIAPSIGMPVRPEDDDDEEDDEEDEAPSRDVPPAETLPSPTKRCLPN